MDDLKEYADRLKFEIMAADFLTTEDREMVFDLIEKVLGDDNAVWYCSYSQFVGYFARMRAP